MAYTTKPSSWSNDQWNAYQNTMQQYQQPQAPQTPQRFASGNPTSPMMPQAAPAYDPAKANDAAYDAAMSIMPDRPDYMSSVDSSGHLLDQYSLMKSDIGKTMSSRATSTEASPWAQIARASLNTQTQGALDQADQQGAQSGANARDQMSQYGGLSEGARERIASTGARATALNKNAIERNATTNDQQIGMQDAQMKQGLMGQVATMQQADDANALQGVGAKNTYNQNLYDQQMKAWAANKQADATAKSGKK